MAKARENVFNNLETYASVIDSPRTFIENFCYITTKDGKFTLLKLNEPQKKLMDMVEKALKEKRPVRIRVLKARQMGFSTLISALGFWWSGMHENMNYAVVAHKDTSASSIFEKNKVFYDNLPPAMKPQVDRFNSERISFNSVDGKNSGSYDVVKGLRSKIFFGTAGGGELFRGETIHFLHKSEKAFWEDKSGILEKALNATVPLMPFTAIIEETTANGYNAFKDDWDNSVMGRNDYETLFVGWHEMDEYQMKPPTGFTLTDKELKLQMMYDLTDEQLAWRRYKIANDYNGNELWFQQEYPMTPEEAFIASGFGVFSAETIMAGYQGCMPPIRTMALNTEIIGEKLQIWEEPESKEIIEYQQLTRWNDDKQDYEYYDSDIMVAKKTVFANYTIGIDTAGMGADFSVFRVWHNIKKIMVASLRVKNLSEERLANIAIEIARMYFDAMIAPEVNFSHAICDYIFAKGYNNIYLTENLARADRVRESLEYGFMTTTLTKPPIISGLRALLNEAPTSIRDRAFWYEAEYYILMDVARNIMNAASGHHDDTIMADAIAYYVSCSFQAKQVYSTRVTKNTNGNRQNNGIMLFGNIKASRPRAKTPLKKGVYNNNA